MNKKEELLMNTAKIIYEEGIQKLTMAYLAQVSGITKGGVLYHFESKRNLLLQMNEMAIKKFEDRLEYHLMQLSGDSLFTRAYAFSTLDFLQDPASALLPAVFISSLEDQASYKLWEETSLKWEAKFKNDSGDTQKNLELRLMCDGIWFSIMYTPNNSLNKQMAEVVLNYCQSLEGKDY